MESYRCVKQNHNCKKQLKQNSPLSQRKYITANYLTKSKGKKSFILYAFWDYSLSCCNQKAQIILFVKKDGLCFVE